MKSRRSLATGLIAVVLVLLLSGVGSLLWSLTQGPLALLRGSSAEPGAAMFIPKQAPVMLSLVVNPNRLSHLGGWLPGRGRRTRTELRQLQDGLLTPAGLDYDKDIRPWIGDEVTLAVTDLDLDRDRDNGRQPGYLLALATGKPQRAREFLQLYWQRRAADGTRLQFEQVSGLPIVYAQPPLGAADALDLASATVATALVGDRYVLFANQPKLLRSAINRVQVPELNLLNAPHYRRALETLGDRRVAFGFANINSLGGWIAEQGLTVSTAQSAPSPGQSPPGLYDAAALALRVTRQGLLADSALLERETDAPASPPVPDSPPSPDSPGLAPPRSALQYLPRNAAVAASSTQLDGLWRGTQAVLTSYPAIATVVNRALGTLEAEWKIDFTQEIFPWVKGSYALGQLDRPQGLSDWVFVVDRRTPEAQAGIAHLDELARQQGYSIGTLTLGEQPVTAWTRLKPEGEQDSADKALRALVRGVHGPVGQDPKIPSDRPGEGESPYEVFATSLEAMESVLQAPGKQALANSKGFRQAIAPLPDTAQGYLHLNWADSEATLTQQLPVLRILKLAARPLFRNLQSVTLSGYPHREGLQRAAIALRLGQ